MFIRLWVNMIRTGKLITSDIVGGLMDALVAAGWKPSGGKNSQQDAGELFAFITEKLNMPLLTLKVDIAHGGKEDKKDDHKLINESLLHVPIPGSPSDPPILLEECLELYFSNSVQVSRQLERRKTLESITDVPRAARGISFQGSSAMRIERPRKFSLHLDRVDNLPGSIDPSSASVASSASSSAISLSSLSLNTNDSNRTSTPSNPDSRLPNSRFPGPGKISDSPKSLRESPRRGRANSRATVLSYDSSNNEKAGSSISNEPLDRSLRATRSQDSDDSGVGSPPTYDSVYRDRSPPIQFAPMNGLEKYVIPGGTGASAGSNELWNNNMEITLPAWMFLQLLPFYTETGDKIDTSAHGTSSPVAQHFANARPVLGISLKRYAMTNSGEPVRNDRMVVVPKTIRLPSFVADDHSSLGDDAAFGNFKLELESAIFHRGVSLNSGHFVSLAAEDAFISYDENKEHLQSLTKKKSYTERLFGTRGILSSSKKDELGSATAPPVVEVGNISPPSSAVTSPQLRPSEPDVVRKAPKDKRWILMDDLQPPDKKVTIVDFDKIFKEEVPYMLFYRMVALDEETLDDLASGITSVDSSRTPTVIASDQNLDPISPIQTIVSWPQTNSNISHSREQSLARPSSGGTSVIKHEGDAPKHGRRGFSPERRKRGRAKGENYREEKCLIM